MGRRRVTGRVLGTCSRVAGSFGPVLMGRNEQASTACEAIAAPRADDEDRHEAMKLLPVFTIRRPGRYARWTFRRSGDPLTTSSGAGGGWIRQAK